MSTKAARDRARKSWRARKYEEGLKQLGGLWVTEPLRAAVRHGSAECGSAQCFLENLIETAAKADPDGPAAQAYQVFKLRSGETEAA